MKKEQTGEIKNVLNNVFPSMISMVMVLVYNLADTFFIGQTGNAYMVAATSLVTPAFTMFTALGVIFGTGGTSLISRKLGEGKSDYAKKISSFCFWTAVGVGSVVMIVVLLFNGKIVGILGATDATREFVREYLSIVGLSVPFLMISNAFSQILRAEGKAKKAMMGMILGNLTNIILDPIMILGFNWGIKGAAIATVIGNVAGAIFYIMHYLTGKSILSISIKEYQVGENVAREVLSIGIPAALNNVFMAFANIIANNFMVNFGDMAVAGFGVATKVGMILGMLLMGIGTGVQPLLGFAYGEGEKEKFDGIFRFSMLISVVTSILITLLIYVGTDELVRAFVTEPDAFQYGVNFVRIFTISGPALGILYILSNALQGMGAALPSLLVNVSRQGLLYIPLLFLFSTLFKSAEIITAAQPVADILTTILAIVLYICVYKKTIKVLKKKLDIITN